MVTSAGLTPTDLGLTAPKDEQAVATLSMPCDAPLDAQNVAASHVDLLRREAGRRLAFRVLAYYPETGTAVVEQVRPALTHCKTWQWATAPGIWRWSASSPVQPPAGMDNAMAYCHHGTILGGANKGDKVYLCDGLVSRGHLVARVDIVDLKLAAAQAERQEGVADSWARRSYGR